VVASVCSLALRHHLVGVVDYEASAVENVSLDIPDHVINGGSDAAVENVLPDMASDAFDDAALILPSFVLSLAAGVHKVLFRLDNFLCPFGISMNAKSINRGKLDTCALEQLGGMLAFTVMSKVRSSIHCMSWKYYGLCALIALPVCLPLRRRHDLHIIGLSVAASVGVALGAARAFRCGKGAFGHLIFHMVLAAFVAISLVVQRELKSEDDTTTKWRFIHHSLEHELITLLVFEILSLSICNRSAMSSADRGHCILNVSTLHVTGGQSPLTTKRLNYASARCEDPASEAATCKRPTHMNKMPGQGLPVSPRPGGRLLPISAMNRRCCDSRAGIGSKGMTTLHHRVVAPRFTSTSMSKRSNTSKRRSLPSTAPDSEENDIIPGIPRRHSDKDVQPHTQKSTEHVECLHEGLQEERGGSLCRGRQPPQSLAASSSVAITSCDAFRLPQGRSHVTALQHQELLEKLGRRFRALHALKQPWADGDAPKFLRLLERCTADPVIICSGLKALAGCAYCPKLMEAATSLRLAKHVLGHCASELVPGCCALASLKLAERAVNATLINENRRDKQAARELLERMMDDVDGFGQNSGGACYHAARRRLRSQLQSALCAWDS